MKNTANKHKGKVTKKAKKTPVPKRKKGDDALKEYVGYNDPPAQAERINEDLKENKHHHTEPERPKEFSREDLPERTDDDFIPESTRDRGEAEK